MFICVSQVCLSFPLPVTLACPRTVAVLVSSSVSSGVLLPPPVTVTLWQWEAILFFASTLSPDHFFLIPGTVLSADLVHQSNNVLPLTAFLFCFFSPCCCFHQTICLLSPPLCRLALRPCLFLSCCHDSAIKNPLSELIYMHKHSQASLHSPFLVECGCVEGGIWGWAMCAHFKVDYELSRTEWQQVCMG